MSDLKHNKNARIEELELSRETVQDLTEGEARGVQGGLRPNSAHNSCTGTDCQIKTGKCYP